VTAMAPSASAEHKRLRATAPLAAPAPAELSLAPAARLRAALLGIALGVFATATTVLGALLIATGPMHTPLGGLT
jgi:hypothetical protein